MLLLCVLWTFLSILVYKLSNPWTLAEAYRFWSENALDVGIGALLPQDTVPFFTLTSMWIGCYFAGFWLTDFLVEFFSMSPHRTPAVQRTLFWRCALVLILWILIGVIYFMVQCDQTFLGALFASCSLILTNGTGIPPTTTWWENVFIGTYMTVGVP